MNILTSRLAIFMALLGLGIGSAAVAQDDTNDTTTIEETGLTTGNEGGQFSDPNRLVDTLMQDDQIVLEADLAQAEADQAAAGEDLTNIFFVDVSDPADAQGNIDTALADAETAVNDAVNAVADFNTAKGAQIADLEQQEADGVISEGDKQVLNDLRGELEGLEKNKSEAESFQTALVDTSDAFLGAGEAAAQAQADFDAEREAVEAKVAELDDEQVFAFNRAFNNAIASGLNLQISAEDLEGIEDFNRQQINSFTKAYESEAKFLEIAEKTGQTEKFEAKAEAQKTKFLAKVDKFDSTDATTAATAAAKGSAKNAAKNAATGTAKQAAKGAAKGAAKQAAKGAAEDAAKQAAKGAAKGAAKQAAKQTAKEEAKNKGKGQGKKST